MSALSLFQKLRHHGVLFSSHLHWVGSSSTFTSYLQAATELSPEQPLAAIPDSSVLTVDRLVDVDKLGFCADQSFLNGKYPEAVLAHYASLRFCLQDPWFQQQLLLFNGVQGDEKIFCSLKTAHVTAPKMIFEKALGYVRQRAVVYNGSPALVPLVDCIPLGSHGNVSLRYESSLQNTEALSRFRGVKKALGKSAPYVIVTARKKILAKEKLFLHDNHLVCQSEKSS